MHDALDESLPIGVVEGVVFDDDVALILQGLGQRAWWCDLGFIIPAAVVEEVVVASCRQPQSSSRCSQSRLRPEPEARR